MTVVTTVTVVSGDSSDYCDRVHATVVTTLTGDSSDNCEASSDYCDSWDQ